MRTERTGERDLTYSNWHRRVFDGPDSFIDLDWIEICQGCSAALMVYELARVERATANPDERKPALGTMGIARRLGIPGFVFKYRPAPEPCRCPRSGVDPTCQWHGIDRFYVEQLYPSRREGSGDYLGAMSPADVVDMIARTRAGHVATCPLARVRRRRSPVEPERRLHETILEHGPYGCSEEPF